MADEQAIRTRVDDLIAEMTTAEKAGQLTQYFYFGSERAISIGVEPGSTAGPSAKVEAALGRGEAGSLLFVTDPAEFNRLQRLAVEGHRLGSPCCSASTSSTRNRTDPAGADRVGRLLGPRDDRARPGRRGP